MLRPKTILFLSTGDTCRSAMAAAYFRKLLEEHNISNIQVKTAGVSTIVGLLASPESVQVMKNEGLDLGRHRSSQLTADMLRRADLIFGMSPYHVQSALRLASDCRSKIHLLKEFTHSDLKNVQISDPMGGTLEIYKKCFGEIKAALNRLIRMPDVVGVDIRAKAKAQRTISAKKQTQSKRMAKKTAAKTKKSSHKMARCAART